MKLDYISFGNNLLSLWFKYKLIFKLFSYALIVITNTAMKYEILLTQNINFIYHVANNNVYASAGRLLPFATKKIMLYLFKW